MICATVLPPWPVNKTGNGNDLSYVTLGVRDNGPTVASFVAASRPLPQAVATGRRPCRCRGTGPGRSWPRRAARCHLQLWGIRQLGAPTRPLQWEGRQAVRNARARSECSCTSLKGSCPVQPPWGLSGTCR